MGICQYCGIATPGNQNTCQTCQRYIRKGGIFYPLPPKGEVVYTEDDKVVCHICGMAFSKLAEHVKKKHKMSDREYRQEFGLKICTRLTSLSYHEKMRNLAETYPNYQENFKDVWSGEKACRNSRGGKKQSLQEINQRREEQRVKGRLSKSKITPERFEELKKIWTKNLPTKKEGVENE